MIDLKESPVFSLLQQGMKDRYAYGIVALVSVCPELLAAFEQYAKDELNKQDEDANK